MCHELSSLSEPDSFHHDNKYHVQSYNGVVLFFLYSYLPWLLFVVIHRFLASGRGLVVQVSNYLMSKTELWTAIIMFSSKLLSALTVLFPFVMWDFLTICCFWLWFWVFCCCCLFSWVFFTLSLRPWEYIYGKFIHQHVLWYMFRYMFQYVSPCDSNNTICSSKFRFQLAINSLWSENLSTQFYVVP